MSAKEVLEHVKALPPRQRRKLCAGVRELETALEPVARRKHPVRWPDAAARRREFLATRFSLIWFCWRGNRSAINAA